MFSRMCRNASVCSCTQIRCAFISEQLHLSKKEAKNKLEETDKHRRDYYEYYTGNRWDDLDNYDLCIDSDKMTIDGAVALIRSCIEIKQKLGS